MNPRKKFLEALEALCNKHRLLIEGQRPGALSLDSLDPHEDSVVIVEEGDGTFWFKATTLRTPRPGSGRKKATLKKEEAS